MSSGFCHTFTSLANINYFIIYFYRGKHMLHSHSLWWTALALLHKLPSALISFHLKKGERLKNKAGAPYTRGAWGTMRCSHGVLSTVCTPARQALNEAQHKHYWLINFEGEGKCTELTSLFRQFVQTAFELQVDTGLTDTGSTRVSFVHRWSGFGSTLGTKAFVRLCHRDLVV